MKAINCSQCGALIERVRIRDDFAECSYCHSATPILKDKIVYVQEKPKPKLRKLSEDEQKSVLKSFDSDDIPFLNEEIVAAIPFVIFGLVFTILIFYVSFSSE